MINFFKKKFERAIGVYFDDEKIFCVLIKYLEIDGGSSNRVNLSKSSNVISKSEIDTSSEVSAKINVKVWKVVDTEEETLNMMNESIDIESEIETETTILDGDHFESTNDIEELIAQKVSEICITRNWQTETAALCLNADKIIIDVEDFSNIPRDRLESTVNYQIAAAGNFEPDAFLASFMEINPDVWMEGISSVDVEKWSKAFAKYKLNLLALTAMPESEKTVEIDRVDLTEVDPSFLDNGGMCAVFAAKSLIYQMRPNFLLEHTKDLTDWNFSRIAAVIIGVVFILSSLVTAIDFWNYQQTKSELENEKSQFALLERDRRKKDFIERNLAELQKKNQLITEISNGAFPWRSLLIYFGTIKVKGVWLKEIYSSENQQIEIKCEAVSYETMAEYVKTLESDSALSGVGLSVKNSEVKNDSDHVNFVIVLALK